MFLAISCTFWCPEYSENEPVLEIIAAYDMKHYGKPNAYLEPLSWLLLNFHVKATLSLSCKILLIWLDKLQPPQDAINIKQVPVSAYKCLQKELTRGKIRKKIWNGIMGLWDIFLQMITKSCRGN